MGFWETLSGRRREVAPKTDPLFALPAAAVTLEVAGWRATGSGSVCYRAAAGGAFAAAEDEVVALLDADDDPDVVRTSDDFGFSWLTVQHADPSPSDRVGAVATDLHAVTTALEAAGFGPSLLCVVVPFAREHDGRCVGLVYLSKRGRFYPFAPAGPQQRDNLLEMQVRDLLRGELPLEEDLSRWFAVWGAPGL